ncbi:MAG: rRNA maturation RNase YbeY [Chloroflexi bacterium]|nr:rRNA maturation RNase YbeY [Chloroflexota bacterium]
MAENSVLISVKDRFESAVDQTAMVALAERVLAAESVDGSELGIVVTDDEQIRDLNRKYADEDKATDVLSFSLREGEEFVSPDDVTRLGEVIISYPTAERQAKEAGHSATEEVSHLLVHGILHLLGYDHAEPDDERKMRAREDELLGTSHH